MVTLEVGSALCAACDTQDIGWLNRFTPPGLRATVQPLTADRLAPLVRVVALALVLAGVALVLNARRELGGSVRTRTGLVWRLQRSSVLEWSVGTAVGGALFAAMGSGVIESAHRGRLLKAQLGEGDPVGAYFGYTGSVIGKVVAVRRRDVAIGWAGADSERHPPIRMTGTAGSTR